MPNTYTQLHHQFVFATKFRASSIHASWKEELHKIITAIVQHRDHKMIQINTMPDHLHMFFREDFVKIFAQNRLFTPISFTFATRIFGF